MSRYLVFTGVVTDAPEGPVQEINTLRYDLLLKHRNYRKEYFHATEDPEYVRTAVYRIIDSLASTLRVNSLVVQKQALYPAFQSLSAYYPILAGIVLHYFFNPRGLDARRYDDVLIFVDKEKEQRDAEGIEEEEEEEEWDDEEGWEEDEGEDEVDWDV